MFNNIPEMFSYIEKLRKTLDEIILSRKEQLNNFCECCHKKEIEVEWRPTNFCNEYLYELTHMYNLTELSVIYLYTAHLESNSNLSSNCSAVNLLNTSLLVSAIFLISESFTLFKGVNCTP